MLRIKSKIISLGRGKLAVYLPHDLTIDSEFDFKQGEQVTITASNGKITVEKE